MLALVLAGCGAAPAEPSPSSPAGAGSASDPADVVTGASRLACGSGRDQCAEGWVCARAIDGRRVTPAVCARPTPCGGVPCESEECVALLEPSRVACVI